ncbi:MAG: hypothetical protein ACE5G0_13720 [Rhodothermales bacterium]
MQIRFLKGKDKPHTLSCIRADGTRTWTRLYQGFGPQHDLAHYAVETTLGFEHAFYGLLAQGHTIEEFAETDDRRWVGDEALLTEAIVMALQYEVAGSSSAEAFFETVEGACRGLGITVLDTLTPDVADTIRERFSRLRTQWEQTPAGGCLELDFPETPP